METVAPATVDGLSALITHLGHRQVETLFVNVAGQNCVAIPGTIIERHTACPDRKGTIAGIGTVGHDAVPGFGHRATEQEEYLSAWRSEMEYFDRF